MSRPKPRGTVYTVGNKVSYRGQKWENLTFSEKHAIVGEFFNRGVGSEGAISKLMNGTRAMVGNFITRNKNTLPTRPRSKNGPPPRFPKPEVVTTQASESRKEERDDSEEDAAEAEDDTPPPLRIGFCTKEIGRGDDIDCCGKPTGDIKLKRCDKHTE